MGNMFKPVKAKTVATYMKSVPAERKESIRFLHDFIRKTVPRLKSHFAYNMLGYGQFDYVNAKGEEIKWPVVALASQKNYISVYVCAVKDGEYIAEKYRDRLGKVSVGRSCIRFKKLEAVDLKVLGTVLREAAKSPGLVGAGEHRKKK